MSGFVWKQGEGRGHAGYRRSAARPHGDAPCRLTQAHARPAPNEGAFHSGSASPQTPGSAPPTAPPIPAVVGLSRGPGTKPPSHPSAALDFWPTSFFPAWLPLGTDVSKLHISPSEHKSGGLGPGREPSGRRSGLPGGAGWPAGRHEGREAGRPGGSPRPRRVRGAQPPGTWARLQDLPGKAAPGPRLPGKPLSSCTSRAAEGAVATHVASV